MDETTTPFESDGREVHVEEELRRALSPNYLLVRHLATGGMGAVWLARDPALRRSVAVKVLSADLAESEEARARFAREAQAVAALSHPNVISIYSVGVLKPSGLPFFVMEYVEGGSLADRVAEEGPLPLGEARRLLGEVAGALAAAHDRGVIHRDVKASNVLVDAGSGRALVTDWGIAGLDPTASVEPDVRLTKEGTFLGSPKYMSPEQLTGDLVAAESDLYSLGLMAYELLTGDTPFPGETPREVMIAHLRDEPPALTELRPDVDPVLASLVSRCVDKDPSERPAAAEVAARLTPGGDSVLEWPPPGLEGLQGVAYRFATTLGAGSLLLAEPLLAGALVSPETYRSDSRTFAALSAFAVVVGLLLVARALHHLWRAARVWYPALGHGYGWRTLAEVAADRRGDTGALLVGGAEYAGLGEDVRMKLGRSRLVRAGAVVGAALSVWPGALAALAVAGRVEGGGAVLVTALAPGVALLGLAVASGVPERRLTVESRRAFARRRRPVAAVAPLIRSWYETFRRVVGADAGRATGGRRWVAAVLAVVVAVAVLTGATPLLSFASLAAAGPSAVEAAVPKFSQTREKVRALEPARSVRLPPDSAVTATEAGLLVAEITALDVGEWWDSIGTAASLESPLKGYGPYDAAHALALDSLLVVASRGLDPAERRYLAGFAADPRFPAFEKVARAHGFDEWASFADVGDWETATLRELPIPRLASIREVGYNKVAQAALAYSEGDVEAAETALRELISVGFLLAEDGTTLITSLVGAVLGNIGRENLQLLYGLTDQPEKARAIQEVTGAEAVEADPALRASDPNLRAAMLRVARDTTAPRSLRIEMLHPLLLTESCADPARLLRGPPPNLERELRGPLRDQLVRHPQDGRLLDVILEWAPRSAARAAEPGFWSAPGDLSSAERLVMALFRFGWRMGRLLGNDRLAGCFATLPVLLQ